MTTTKPAAAKKPADHKPKQVKPRRDGDHLIVTVREREWRVPEDALDDLEVMEALENNNVLPALRALLTGDQFDVMKDALRDPDTGRVKYSAATEFLGDLMGALNPNS